jgi:hypothetical protein
MGLFANVQATRIKMQMEQKARIKAKEMNQIR